MKIRYPVYVIIICHESPQYSLWDHICFRLFNTFIATFGGCEKSRRQSEMKMILFTFRISFLWETEIGKSR